MKYERLFIDEIDDAVTLAERAKDYRVEYNQTRPHEAIARNRPQEVHLGLADPTTPPVKPREPCQLLDTGQGSESVDTPNLTESLDHRD